MWWILVLLFATTAQAGQVCLENGTNRLLEYQSGGSPGTCTRNLVGVGVDPMTFEERTITVREWESIHKREIEQPAQDAREAVEVARQAKEDSIRAKLGLTAKEFDDLRDALR